MSSLLQLYVGIITPAVGTGLALSYLITVSQLFSGLRARVAAAAESEEKPKVFLSDLLHCGYCFGTWVYFITLTFLGFSESATMLQVLNEKGFDVLFFVSLAGLGYFYLLWSFIRPGNR